MKRNTILRAVYILVVLILKVGCGSGGQSDKPSITQDLDPSSSNLYSEAGNGHLYGEAAAVPDASENTVNQPVKAEHDDRQFTITHNNVLASITIDPITSDNVINAQEANLLIPITGSVSGGIKAGDLVNFTLNRELKQATVDSELNFRVDVFGQELIKDTHFEIYVNWSDDTGETYQTTASSTHRVDTSASAGIQINQITSGDVINAIESARNVLVTGSVTGDASEGHTVRLRVNDNLYAGLVTRYGSFSIEVPGSDLTLDTTIDASVIGVDSAGNSFLAQTISTHAVDTFTSASIVLDSITSDGIINATEATQTIIVTGLVGGDATSGDKVSLDINNKSYVGPVTIAQRFSIPVLGADLAANPGFIARITGTDDSGNIFNAEVVSTHIVDVTATVNISVVDVTGDGILNTQEAAQTIPIQGSVSGEATLGDVVTVAVNGNTYSSTVDQSNNFSVNVLGADLAAQTTFNLNVSGSDDAGNFFSVDLNPSVTLDFDASATITVDNITADDIITLAEGAQVIAVTGSVGGDASEGDLVSFVLNGSRYTGYVDSFNGFSIDVAGGDLIADTDFDVGVVGSDDSGNQFNVTTNSTHSVDMDVTATLNIDNITPDDIINSAESLLSITVTGTVGGDAEVADPISLSINGNVYAGLVLAGNVFSIDVMGSDLAAQTTILANISGMDNAGNPFDVDILSSHTVDLSASAAIVVDNITADDVIVALEAEQLITVTGSVSGDAADGDAVNATINGVDYVGAVDAFNQFSLDVNGSDLKADTAFFVTISGEDDAGNPFVASVESTHTVDASPPSINAAQKFYYVESQAANTMVGSVIASDDNAIVSYKFSNDTQTSPDGYFDINNTGQITLTAAGAAVGVATNDYELGDSQRYQFIRVQRINDSGPFSFSELRVIEVFTGTNVAEGKAVEASSSESGSYAASSATDGVLVGSVWQSDNVQLNPSLTVDLGAQIDIAQIDIVSRQDIPGDAAERTNFAILASNNADFSNYVELARKDDIALDAFDTWSFIDNGASNVFSYSVVVVDSAGNESTPTTVELEVQDDGLSSADGRGKFIVADKTIAITQFDPLDYTILQSSSFSAYSSAEASIRLEAELTDANAGASVQGGFTGLNQNDWFEWHNFSMNSPGDYIVNARVSTPNSNAELLLSLSDINYSFPGMSIPNTGGWENWSTVSMEISIGSGQIDSTGFQLRATAGSADFNVDYIEVVAKDTTIYAGADLDWVEGGEGVDRIYLGDTASPHSDSLSSVTASTMANYQFIQDAIISDTGGLLQVVRDQIASAADIAHGAGGDDYIYGEEGTDAIYGGDGNDTLIGDEGRDAVRGGVGDDLIIGGRHADVMQGDGGQDTFLWELGDEDDSGDLVDNSKTDIITDFFIHAVSGDNINLAELLVGESSTAVSLDNFLSFVKAGDDTLIYIDINGDGAGTDWTIRLSTVDLAADFNSDQDIINNLLINNALVVDAGDATPPSINAGQEFSYGENQSAGALVATIIASDDEEVASFRFTSGNQTSSDGYYQINDLGEITLSASGAAIGVESNEYEVLGNTFVQTVIALDAVGNESSPTSVTLHVTDDGAGVDDGRGNYIVSGSDYTVTAYDANNPALIQYTETTSYQTSAPIFLQAESYNSAGGGTWPGVRIDAETPFRVQDFNTGEWMRWDNLTFERSGFYSFGVRAAKGEGFGDGVDLSLFLNDRLIEITATENIVFSDTGGWGDEEDGLDWSYVENSFYVDAIANVNFEIVTNIDAVNLDWISITPRDLVINTGAGLDLVLGGPGGELIDLGDTVDINDNVGVTMTAAQLATTLFVTSSSIADANGLLQNVLDEIVNVGDVAYGAAGADAIFGHGGTDFIAGGSGYDYLHGGPGRDVLRGGPDDDQIIGGPGVDVLIGDGNSTSADTFIWQSGDELEIDILDTSKTDIVLDFDSANGDVLALDGILQGEFRNATLLDPYLNFRQDGADTIIDLDVDGDGGGTDWSIRLVGVDLNASVDSDEAIISGMLAIGSLFVDSADNTAPIVTSAQSFSSVENQEVGAIVGTVAATDSSGVTGFKFDNNSQTSADGYYQIDNDGVITLTAAGVEPGVPNNEYEAGSNSFPYQVIAFDLEGNESAATEITINVVDDGSADDDGLGTYIVTGSDYNITAYDPYDPTIIQYTLSTDYRGARELELTLTPYDHTNAGDANGVNPGVVSIANGYFEHLAANEWVAYDNNINFSESTTYTLEIEVARESGGTAPLNFDFNQGTINLGGIWVPSTGGWGTFIVMSLDVYINAGTYSNFGVSTQSGGANWRNIRFYKDGEPVNISTGAGRDWVEAGAGDDTIALGDTAAVYDDNMLEVTAATLASYDFADIGSIVDVNGLLHAVRQEVFPVSDMAHGADGNDQINGNAGTDAIYGGDGNDTLNGGTGRDIVRGGRGEDLIIGGAGADVLRGDADADIFYWQNGDHLGSDLVDTSATDIVIDFQRDIDKLHLANLLQGESQNSASLSNYLTFSYDGVSTTIAIDTNGDGSGTDWSIELRQINLNADTQTAAQIIDDMLSRGELETD